MRTVPGPVFWLTRDSFAGQLEDHIDVWESAPIRRVFAADDYGAVGIEWLDCGAGMGLHVESLTLAEATLRFRTLPETDRECVRIG